MKKLFLVIAIGLVAFTACAQKLDASKVPAAVKAAFAKKYPGITAKWENEKGNFEANFKQDGSSMSLLIDPNGTITETEMAIKASGLPAAVLAYMREHYTGKKIKEAAMITRADGTVNYEAEVNETDIIFDANGKFLKETKDED